MGKWLVNNTKDDFFELVVGFYHLAATNNYVDLCKIG